MHDWLCPMDGSVPLGETGKRAAERAQRAETPAKFRRVEFINHINNLDARHGSRFTPLGLAETGGNWRKPPPKILSAVLLPRPKGVPIGITLAEIAGIARSVP